METVLSKIFNSNKNRNRILLQEALFRMQEAGAQKNAFANAKTHMIFMRLKTGVLNKLAQ
jgi:hypothetical protein